jgi:hypothetical protein
MRALAIDQAPVNSGWAIGAPDMKAPLAGMFRMKSWGDEEGARLVQYQEWLSGLIAEHGITHLFREQLYPIIDARSFETVQAQAKIVGVIELTAARHGLPLQQVLIADWRRRFLGTTKPFPGLKGDKARQWFKQEAVTACARRGWLVENTDAAEACGILDFGLASIDPRYESLVGPLFRRQQHRADHMSADFYRGIRS